MNYTRNKGKYAEAIMQSTIMALKREMPELAMAFKIVKLKPVEFPINISTDFRRLFYNPDMVIALKENGHDFEIEFQIMHVILHGLLGDYVYTKYRRQPKAMHLALDQRVDTILVQLGFKSNNPKLLTTLRKMREKKPYCSTFANPHTSVKSKGVLKRAGGIWHLIMSDYHDFWMPIYVQKMKLDDGEENLVDIAKEWESAAQIITSDSTLVKANAVSQKLQDSQKRNKWGRESAGSKVEVLRTEGEALDYKSVLAQVLTFREDPREKIDSIDPMYYYFSLEHYENILLLEPRENEEEKRINTICVAIDTSGSCEGKIAQIFLNELCSLIDSLAMDVVQGKLLLIQCDNCIQYEKLYNISELNLLDFGEMELCGYGGTSFIPVFERIKQYREETGDSVDALIYLTDGCGDYPEEETDYPTVFVLTEEEELIEEGINIPSWITTCGISMEDSYGCGFW